MDTRKPVVYIVDDDKDLRTSLAWLLESVSIQAQCFAGAEEFLAHYDPGSPACLVLDVRMPETSGFQLQAMLNERGAALPIIFVSAHGDIPMSVQAMKNGALDFVEKPYNPQQMLERIQAALKAAVQVHAGAEQKRQLQQRLDLLTGREREVLGMVIDGKASKVIARELNISVKTVDVHRTKIKEKMGVSSIALLVREVLDLGVP
ncbi:Two-component response regulator, FixJ family, consists of REC and HTH domains [Pseudomonas citronellolis]|jgi:FixJ family two-component response regulator|uniref:Response regulator n=1 Tax=Pseudomonas citronellolis TaxID=53408 RepID=A0AAQ1KEW8_9PSED|nr:MULTISPECIES: response regulator [Pseudomonas]KSW27854.1 LuxR family transcriptional regulator [Pseudomonas sp. ADP]MCP1643173.1 FixJ family two-component response regulator [Pseudomonas citronellolis]MCP1666099.1 FixJ family two-component response regulator [Pseudomonas citronellolis]MCP1698170.1 FixJ family two-component response regulator [Pseudomonas citronellolis]MCP1703846.1 FixJ family two-component response regulator [Pseudomonas citronellolis]